MSSNLFRRYSRLFGPDPERDVDEEIAFHVAMRVEEFKRAGMTAAEAEVAAMQRFGNVHQVRDECRDLGRRRVARRERTLRLDALRQDVRIAWRTLLANRGFSVIILLTLALGIGANSAVFSVVYGVLLRPLPYRHAEELVRLWSKNTSRNLEFFSVSPADYIDWRTQHGVFTAMAAFERQHDATLLRGDEPQAVPVSAVTPDVFPLLGVSAQSGRTLVADDAQEGAPPAAVIDYTLWTSRFGSDRTLIGSDLTIDGTRYTVVGVMPPQFSVPGTAAQIWTALSLAKAPDDHGNRYLRVLARRAPGVTLARALGQMDQIAARLAQEYPATNGTWSVNAMAVTDMIIGSQFRRAVLVLLGVVGVVLLIACANSANLQLARAAARRREIAVRTALGATRGRILAQLFTESLMLGLVAGIAGLALAYGGIAVLRAVGANTIPRLDQVRLDAPVLGFTALVALGSSVLFGLLPALGAARSDVGEVLKQGGRGEGQMIIGQRLRAALVVAEVSMSLILLIGAGLLLRSFARLQSVDTGFNASGIVALPLRLSEASYPDVQRAGMFYDGLVERIRQLPGVTDVAAVSSAPFAGPNTGMVFLPEGREVSAQQPLPDADDRLITPGYLHTLGVRLIRGRDFSTLDRDGAPGAVLISEATARRYWPNEDPLGQRLRARDLEKGPMYTVVGIVADVRYQSLETPEIRPMLYFSALADPQRVMTVLIRGASVAGLSEALRPVLTSLDPTLPTPTVYDLDELLGDAMATPRFALVLFAVFAGAALLLAAIGIYGVMSYLVRQRTHELGIRVALGASPLVLIASVVGRALRWTLLGVALGLAAARGLAHLISALLFGVSATDSLTFVGVPLLLSIVAILASLLPAMRAARADPMLALRGEA